MATYVVSDIHGRLHTLDRLLARVSPGEEDRMFVLGDMVDRGADPVGVMRLCRSLPSTEVLIGNHEELMLDFVRDPEDPVATLNWAINGGVTTAKGLARLKEPERVELCSWVEALPHYLVETIGDQLYVLVHAGIRPEKVAPHDHWDAAALEQQMQAQDSEDLTWIREGYLDCPTGLVGQDGIGPLVVAGHTPTPLAADMADVCDRPALNEDQRCQMLRLGATEHTGGRPDRYDIDCGAGSVPDHGRLLMLRLDDEAEFYEDVVDGD